MSEQCQCPECKKEREMTGPQVLAFFISLLVILPIIIWCMIFIATWVVLNFPFDIPHPVFLADCLSRGGWACDKV